MNILELLRVKKSSYSGLTTPQGLFSTLGGYSDIGRQRQNVTYKYKNWQFFYHENSLNLIAAYNDNEVRETGKEAEIWKMNIKQFLAYLNHLNIDWKYDESYPKSDDADAVILQSGCKIYLDLEENNIHAIMYEVE